MNTPFGKESALRSALVMTGATYINYASGLLISMLVARSLGPADYGRYAYLVWLAGVLIMLFNNGLTTTGITFIAQCRGREDLGLARTIHAWLRRGHLVSLAVVSAVFLLALPWIRPAEWDAHLWLFAAIALVSAMTKSSYIFGISVAKGYGVFGIEAMISNAMSLSSLLGAVVLVWLRAPLAAYLALFVAVSAGHMVMTRLLLRRHRMEPLPGPLPDDVRLRIRTHLLWTIVLTSVATFSNKSIETFLLNLHAGPEAVGYFLIGAALTRGGVELLSSGLSAILMSMMGRAYGAGGAPMVAGILRDAVRYYHFLGFLLAGVGVLWAAPMVRLMYGSHFAAAAPVLQVMVVVAGLTASEGAFGALLSTTDHQRSRAMLAIFSVSVSAVCAFALVPTYGLPGALMAHAASRLIVFAIGLRIVLRIVDVQPPYAALARTFAAAGVGALAAGVWLLWMPGLIGQLIAGALFALVYVSASLSLRVWTARDLAAASAHSERVPLIRGLMPHLERWVRTST